MMADFTEEPTESRQTTSENFITSDDSGEAAALSLWDLNSGYCLNTYKGETPAPRTLALLTNDYFVYAAKSRPALFVHSVCKKDQVHLKMDMPGLVSVLAVTRSGDCVVAAVDQKIFLWQVWSGQLMAQISVHLSKVTCLRFTDTGGHFVSADDLGTISTWSKTKVVEDCLHHRQPSFQWKASRHAGAVTDLHTGTGGIGGSVVSASVDRTCRIWDVASGQLMYTLTFDAAISSVTMDISELLLFAGDERGRVFVVMTRTLQSQEVHINADTTESYICRKHNGMVTFLAISQDLRLVSGSADKRVLCGGCQENYQVAKNLDLEHKGEITNLLIPDIPLNPSESSPRLVRPPPFTQQLYSLDDPFTIKMAIGSTDPKLPEESDYSSFSQDKEQLREDVSMRKELDALRENASELFQIIKSNIL